MFWGTYKNSNKFMELRNVSMKKIASILLAIVCIVMVFTGCSNSKDIEETFTTSPSGYITSPGKSCEITDYLTYEVIEYNGEYLSVIDEAEELVREWWNDDSTFHRPEIIWV